MSKLRKLMAVIVSVAMMVSLFVAPAFAEQTMTDIEVCELLSVLKGTGDGLTAEYLASKPTRYQTARLFLRLQGLEEEAIAFEGAANFSDVEALADWQLAPENKALIAYLYANPELGYVGYPDGTFRPFRESTAMEYYKVLLTALGYEQGVDFEYGEDLLEFAAGLGLTEVAAVEEFTIRHLATATVEALKAVVKDSEETLIEKLVAEGVIDEDLAIETGIYKEAVVALEVDEIYADNLAEVYVKFNQAMDKGTIKADNFKVAGEKVQAASLLDDGATVKLAVNFDKASAASNGANYKVEITKDVKSASGMAFEEAYSANIRVFDNELPFITGIELTGPKTIEITYSEPIKTKPTVKINKGVYGNSVEDIKSVTNKVIVTIAASKLPEGTYTLDITGAVDYAGFKMDDDKWELAYAADNSPITAEVTSATQPEVKVKFSKRVTLKSGEWESYFYHTFSSHMPIKVTSSDNRTYTLRFVKVTGDPDSAVSYPIPEGTTQLVVKYKGASGTKISDEWGNTLESNIVIPITVAADITAPEVVGEVKVVDAKTIKIYFSEALDKASVEDKDNYVVENNEGKKVEGFSATYESDPSKDEYVAKLVFDADLAGNYNVTVKGITDASVNKNEMVQTTLAFFVDDMTAPDLDVVEAKCIEGAAGEKDIIYVYYPEKMTTEGKYSVIDASNYLLGGKKLPEKTTLELFGSTGTVVKITLPDNSLNVEGSYLTVARVADLAGNVSLLLSKDVKIVPEVRPAVEAIEQTAANKLTFVFDSILESVLADAFVIEVAGKDYTVAGVEEWTVKDRKTTVKVALTDECIDAIKDNVDSSYGKNTGKLIDDYVNIVIKIAGEFIVAETGMTEADADTPPKATTVTVEDKWAPIYEDITVSAATYEVTLTFSEVLDHKGSYNYAWDLVIKNLKGDTLTAGKDYTTSVVEGSKELVIKFKDGTDLLEKASDKKYFTVASQDSITYIQDMFGNKIEKFGAKEIK
jgi:hypothetical protein